MELITTESIASHVAFIKEPIIIKQKQNARMVFISKINDIKVDKDETVSGTLIHQRKKGKDEWENIESINLATLKGGEGVRIKFNSEELRKLFVGLQKHYKLSTKGVPFGIAEYAIGKPDEIIEVPKERREVVNQLLSANYGEEIWQQLIDKNPDLATKLSFARIQSERIRNLAEFNNSLISDKPEEYWQEYFTKNQWIFGYGLKYCFLTELSSQPIYGGQNFTGKGNQKGDFLLSTEAEIKFTVLVEIKKATTDLLYVNRDGKPKKYRNGAYLLSRELLGGVSQIQINCKTWQRKAFEPENVEILTKSNIQTVCPQGILLIGNTKQLKTQAKIETFEAFRRSISNPQIITFDELYDRAKYIIHHDELKIRNDSEIQEDDLPF